MDNFFRAAKQRLPLGTRFLQRPNFARAAISLVVTVTAVPWMRGSRPYQESPIDWEREDRSTVRLEKFCSKCSHASNARTIGAQPPRLHVTMRGRCELISHLFHSSNAFHIPFIPAAPVG